MKKIILILGIVFLSMSVSGAEEAFEKVDANTLKITTTQIFTPVVTTKDLAQLQEELKTAQDSLAYVQSRHAAEIAPIQATINRMQARLDEAIRLVITAKPKVK